MISQPSQFTATAASPHARNGVFRSRAKDTRVRQLAGREREKAKWGAVAKMIDMYPKQRTPERALR